MTGLGISAVGDGALLVLIPLAVLGHYANASLVSMLFVALTLPHLLIALPVGVVIDRWDRLFLLRTCAFLKVLCSAGLALCFAFLPNAFWLLLFLALMLGVAEVVVDSSVEVVVATSVKPERLERVNGQLSALQNGGGGFVGPLVGGVLFSLFGAVAVSVIAILYVVSAVLWTWGQSGFSGQAASRQPTVRPSILAGLRQVVRIPGLVKLSGFATVANMSYTSWTVLFVVFAVSPSGLALSATAYSGLLSVLSLGGVAGSLMTERVRELLSLKAVLLLALGGWTLWLVSPVLTNRFVLVGMLFFVGSLLGSMWNVAVRASRQRLIDPAQLGQVTAVYRMAVRGGRPIGAGLGGLLLASVGASQGIWLSAGVMAALAFVLSLVWHDTD